MPDVGTAIGGIGTVSEIIGKKKAQDAQEDATQARLALERQIYDQTRQDLNPFFRSGKVAQNVLNYELGLGKAPIIGAKPLDIKRTTGPGGNTLFQVGGKTFQDAAQANAFARQNGQQGQRYQGFQKSRDFEVGLQGGLDAIQGTAAGRNMLLSGGTIKAAQKFGTDYTMGYRENYLNRLSGIAGAGQAAAAGRANAGANYAGGAGNALGDLGNVRGAGAIGMANSLNGFLGNIAGEYDYQRRLKQGATA